MTWSRRLFREAEILVLGRSQVTEAKQDFRVRVSEFENCMKVTPRPCGFNSKL